MEMGRMIKAMFLLTMLIFTLSSCSKHGSIYEAPERTADLVVPEGFDWSMTRSVAMKVTSPSATVASFFLSESCTLESQIATLPVPEGETTLHFDVPKENRAIYVQYPLQSGGTKTLKSTITDGRTKAVEGSSDVMFTEPFLGIQNGLIYIPAGRKWGTLMFEDTWPETGDYDFNDVVMNYKMEAKRGPEGISVDVHLKIRALGGSYPYDFAMIIGETKSHDGSIFAEADLIEITNIEVKGGRLSVRELSGTGYPAIIIEGVDNLRIPDTYYNTYEKKDEGVEVSFKVRLACKKEDIDNKFNGLCDPKAFDYFLINQKNKKEIHFIGFPPSTLYTGYEDDNTGGGKYYYKNEQGLVWGLKVPVQIGWAKEKQDMRKVFKNFGQWVEDAGYTIGSNGADPLIWYRNEDINKEYYIAP